ncbi:PAS domain S-box protein [Natronocalculus amylovorans]|uniref:PAS domain S-box protein n=1 Tax=Natronocalculus amylovorans TaxID=2917812 RepID=A0AAE3K8Y2_9EURY|nr:PAS domain S-box protein [Natronocalculus amylovorans]MCL9817511.1 PAS domain S-box protein [Natronocalculus amylovorans]
MTEDRSETVGSIELEAATGLETMPLHSSDLLTLLDEDGIIRYDSPAIDYIYGYDQDELVGTHVTEYFHPDDHDRVLEAFNALTSATEHQIEIVEHRFLVADGSYKWIESIGSSTPTPEGYYVVNTRDISARKEREKQLEEAKRQLEAERDGKEAIRQLLLQTATDGTFAENVCQQLVETHGYSGAWVVRRHRGTAAIDPPHQIDAHYGDDTFRRSDSPEEDAETAVDESTRAVLSTGQPRVVTVNSVDNPALADRLRDCGLTCIRSVPLEHSGVFDGVLTVVRETPETSLTRTLVAEFAAALGFKRNMQRQRDTLRSDVLTEVSVKLDESHFLAALSIAPSLPEETQLRSHELQSDGGMVTYLIRTDDVAVKLLTHAASTVFGVEDITPVRDGQPAVVRIRVPEPVLGTIITNYGGSIASMTAAGGTTELVTQFPKMADISTVIEALRTHWPEATVRTRSVRAVEDTTPSPFESLTIKQKQALHAAAVSGFFDRPQQSKAADIAETLDISQSTFLHHLRAAEKKVFSETFEK